MALAAPTNPDLPSSYQLPGVYFKLNLAASGAGLNSASKRLLLLAYKTSSGTQPSDTPIQVTQQSDANTWFGAGSDIARLYAAAISQVGSGVCDVFCCPVTAPSAGVAATALITIAGTATSAGGMDVWICGYRISIAVANADTATIIGTALAAAINLNTDIPVTAAGTTTVTLTYKHKGLTGNDLPIIVNIIGSAGVTASPGTVAYSGTAGSTGAITVTIGGTVISYTATSSDANTVTSAGVAAAINAGAYPVTATDSSGTVTLLYATDRVVRRITASMGSVTTQTATPACGTTGTTGPTLTTALSTLGAQTSFPVWCTAFSDGGSGGSSIGTIKTHLETYADGINQKGQVLFFGSAAALATAGAIQTSTGVQSATNSAGHYAQIWQVDSPQQAYELAARAAAAVIVEDFQPRNYVGMQLKTRGSVPLLAPHRAVRSPASDLNAALASYYMTPIAYSESGNVNYIVKGRTCADPSNDPRLFGWGVVRTLDYMRYDLNAFLTARFSGKSLKVLGEPKTPNTVTPTSIKEAVKERMRTWDSADFFDDADSIVAAVTATQDAVVPTRVDVGVPLRPVGELDQIAGVLNLT